MIKLRIVFFLVFFISCQSYRMLEGKVRPVYFTPDSSVFNDSNYTVPYIGYSDLLGLRGSFVNGVELKEGVPTKAYIHRPTFFNINNNFLIYPGEHIHIERKNSELHIHIAGGSFRRNNELLFLPLFHQADHYPYFPQEDSPSIGMILNYERNLKFEIPLYTTRAHFLFDSLSNALKVSKKYKKLASNYLDIDRCYVLSLLSLYKKYKDTLIHYGMYQNKCVQLAKVFNNIKSLNNFDNYGGNTNIDFNDLADEILPYKIRKISTVNEFESCFDTAAVYYNGIARDYLLSQLMYRANREHIEISTKYLKKYEKLCSDKTYKKLIHKILKSSDNFTDGLLNIEGKKVYNNLNSVVEENRGKLILLDFWASWCSPCIEELPYLNNLKQLFFKKDIVFIAISLDKEITPWQKFILSNNMQGNDSYILKNSNLSNFIIQYKVNEIPRYILIGKDGKIISADAPRPSDKALQELIEKNL